MADASELASAGHCLHHPRKPCPECPWRTDVPPGRFPPDRFAALAASAYDMSPVLFQCHKTTDDRPAVCAGFLLRGATHNFAIRMAARAGRLGDVTDGGFPLFEDFRSMAIANGVPADSESLKRCRGND